MTTLSTTGAILFVTVASVQPEVTIEEFVVGWLTYPIMGVQAWQFIVAAFLVVILTVAAVFYLLQLIRRGDCACSGAVDEEHGLGPGPDLKECCSHCASAMAENLQQCGAAMCHGLKCLVSAFCNCLFCGLCEGSGEGGGGCCDDF